MAERLILVDDIDGTTTDNVKRIPFSLGTRHYEIDLGPEHRDQLEQALDLFITHARRARPKKNATTDDEAAVRAWATDHGHPVPRRGPVSDTVRAAYTRATAAAVPTQSPAAGPDRQPATEAPGA